MNRTRQRRRFIATVIITVIIFTVVLVCSSATRHNLKAGLTFDWSPAESHSGDAIAGDRPADLYSPAEREVRSKR